MKGLSVVKNNKTLSDFGFEIVVAHFKLTKEQDHELMAMRFVYMNTLKEAPSFSDAMTIRQRVADITKDKISFRYSLYQKYADDFFKEAEDYQRGPLAWAVICKDLESSLCHSEDDDLTESVSRKTIDRACTIIAESHSIITRENIPGYRYKPESFFMAHIEAMEEVADLEKSYPDLSLDELRDMLDTIKEATSDYLRLDTKIGEELSSLIAIADEKIERRLQARQATSAQILAFPSPKR